MTTSILVGQKIRQALNEQNMSQLQLAALIDMNASSLSKRIRGVLPIDVEELNAISTALNMPISSFVDLQTVGGEK